MELSAINIVKVDSKKDLMRFIKFQWKIYKNDPYWVPPLLFEKKNQFNREKNPFFKHAEMELFLAEKDGELVGRIAAIKNDLHNEYNKDNVGFFGFFESIDDQEVANALFDSASAWLKAKGLDAMRGPANPSSNDEYGLLIEGFEDPPRVMMPYNPEYYIKLIENYGLSNVKTLNAYKIENEKLLASEKLVRGAELVRKRYGFEICPMKPKDFNNELTKVKYVYNKAWAPNWGFVPMTEEEMDQLAKDVKDIIDPKLVLFVEVKGEVVAFAWVMPDINYLMKDSNGSLLKFLYRFFTKQKQIRWARVLTLGIIPEYQKKGLDSLLYYEITKRAQKRGIVLGEASWILEDNLMMNRGAELMEGTLYKKYRLYQANI